MRENDNKRQVAAAGPWGTVEWASDTRGRTPAKDFYESLSEQNQAKVNALFNRLACVGVISSDQKFKKLGTFRRRDLFEFKSFQVRLIGEFRKGRRFVVATGVIKQQDKHRPRDLQAAAQTLEEDEARE